MGYFDFLKNKVPSNIFKPGTFNKTDGPFKTKDQILGGVGKPPIPSGPMSPVSGPQSPNLQYSPVINPNAQADAFGAKPNMTPVTPSGPMNSEIISVERQAAPTPPPAPGQTGSIAGSGQFGAPQVTPQVTADPTAAPGEGESLPKPPTPIISPEDQAAYDAANKAYQDALKISPEELSTQEDIDKLIESTKLGFQNIKGETIPMQFITGQLAALEERAINLAEPLERKLARLQAKRESAIEASKYALEREESKIEDEKAKYEPQVITKGQNIVKLDPDTGEYKTVFTPPADAAEAGDQFTLGEGQVRFDAQGNIVAYNPKTGASKEEQENAKQINYQLERANRVITQVDEALADVSGWTTGLGSVLSVIPGTQAKDFAKKVNAIKANIGFNELQAMRAASPTGGALGQVAVQELDFLQGVLGSLDTSQTTAQVKENLEKIKLHFDNWKKAVAESQKQGGAGQSTVGADGSFSW